jgi:ArsR family transcriptional regulator, arsenate/arsenite/antimonite-responsive transcriptional repressor
MQPSGIESGVRLAKLCKALAHPARVLILRHVLARPSGAACGEIVAQLPLAQSTVSQHLKVLQHAGLIAAREDPPRVIYAANPGTLDELRRRVAAL